ncbi:MAG: nitroreductase family protein [Candidatus Lokiarchaeota archaeon]|nr:nitroreductase family protein [Candidatus Lokiarchaeota archaeon]
MIEPDLFLNFIKNRRSIRDFTDKKISSKEIEMILEAGRWSPSASNRQPWNFIIIRNKEIIVALSKLTKYGQFIKQSCIVIAIVGIVRENPNWYVQDTSLASMNMMLMAWSLEIGTCWIGDLDREKAKELLGIKKEDSLLTILPLGYFKWDNPKKTYRKDLKEIIKEIK